MVGIGTAMLSFPMVTNLIPSSWRNEEVNGEFFAELCLLLDLSAEAAKRTFGEVDIVSMVVGYQIDWGWCHVTVESAVQS